MVLSPVLVGIARSQARLPRPLSCAGLRLVLPPPMQPQVLRRVLADQPLEALMCNAE